MPSFLDKLQKGMEEEPQKEDIQEEEIAPEKPSAVLTSKKKIKVKKEKSKKKKKPKEKDKSWFEAEGQLTVDVYETDKDLVVRSAIAGVKPEDLDIRFENDMIIIKGKREEGEEEIKNFFCQECYWGYFSREIILPKEVDVSKAKAKIKDGVLNITIPKIEKEKKRKISVKEEE